MIIYIPTYRRTDNQVSIKSIPKKWLKNTYLVCEDCEKEELLQYHDQIIVLPDDIKGIGNIRQYIIEYTSDPHILYIDDDLKFFKRDDKKLKLVTEEQMNELLDWFVKMLNIGYPIAGLSAQQGNHLSYPDKFIKNNRIYTVYAVNADVLKKHNIKFNELSLMEDFNVTLHLLRFGYENIINTQFAHGQKSSNAKGGCSTYRNAETQSKNAHKLAEIHYPFVKVITKHSKSWKDLEEREDVRISWKKAYTQGRY
jgi:hypothetical protein|tara:strand:- start:429 stop:1190 length:762 start_codon:yes stop_codon:yes gene_type:complete